MHATWTLARAHTHRHISGQRDWRKDFWEEKGFQGMSSQSEQDFFNFKICISKLEDQTTHKSLHQTFIFYFLYFKIHKHCPNLRTKQVPQSAKDFLASKLRSVSQIWGPDNSHFAPFFLILKLQAFPKLEDQTIPPVCTGSFCFKFTSISQTRQLIKIHKHFPNVRTISQDCWLLQNVNSTCVIWWTVTLATCCRWHTDLNQVMKWFQVK